MNEPETEGEDAGFGRETDRRKDGMEDGIPSSSGKMSTRPRQDVGWKGSRRGCGRSEDLLSVGTVVGEVAI